jgi:hypothetical protein
VNEFAIAHESASLEIHRQTFMANGRPGYRTVRTRSPKERSHSRFQLQRAERLGDVVVGPGIQQGHLLLVCVAGRENEDHRVGSFSDFGADGYSGHVRQAEVEHDQRRLLERGEMQSFDAGSRLDYFGEVFRERVRDRSADLGFIVDYESGLTSHSIMIAP